MLFLRLIKRRHDHLCRSTSGWGEAPAGTCRRFPAPCIRSLDSIRAMPAWL